MVIPQSRVKFITLTFKPNRFTYTRLYRNKAKEVIKHLNKMCYKWKYVVELTEKGQLHFHIRADIKDKISLSILSHYWTRKCGFVDIKNTDESLEGKLGLHIYMNKDRLLHRMGYKWHVITDETAHYHVKEMAVRDIDERINLPEGILKYIDVDNILDMYADAV